jgi:hypothetical protein
MIYNGRNLEQYSLGDMSKIPLADETKYTLTYVSGFPILTEIATGRKRRLHRASSGGADDYIISEAQGKFFIVRGLTKTALQREARIGCQGQEEQG